MQGSGSKRLILHCRSCSTSAETPAFKKGPSGCSVFLFLFVIMIILTFLVFEREGKRERETDRQTERQRQSMSEEGADRGRQNRKHAPCTQLSAQSWKRDSNSQPMRS